MRPQSNLRGMSPLIPLRNMILQASSIQLNGSELNPSVRSSPQTACGRFTSASSPQMFFLQDQAPSSPPARINIRSRY